MSTQQLPSIKPNFRAPAIWRKRNCQCRQRVLLCFGLPLLPPSATLLGVAYGNSLTFGVFHVLGFILTCLSVICILMAIFITVWKKWSKDPKKIAHVEEPVINTPRPRTESSASQSSRNGVKLMRMVKIPPGSLVTETETKQRSKKNEKRKQRKHRTKLPPVKEEDGRARFEKSLQERDKTGKKAHKRTKSESRRVFEEHLSEMTGPVKQALTEKHLNMFNLNNQGSEVSLQFKRSLSMSDIGDSASERQDSPKFSRRFKLLKTKT